MMDRRFKDNPKTPVIWKEIQPHPRAYSIRDPQQMVWVLTGDSLIAVPANNNVKPEKLYLFSSKGITKDKQSIIPFHRYQVTLTLIACRDEEFSDKEKGNLVFLGIENKDLCLFCTEIDSKPTLQLKEIKIMDLYKENKSQKPFLFYHNKEGSTSVFQSVSYPDWFIGTSSTANQPVILTQERGKTSNTSFYLDPEN